MCRPDQAVDAYRRVIAARFRERALFYRLSAGLLEVDTPMAALFVKMIPARAAGIMYTRDPANPKSKTLWITATRGLGLGIASGRNPADLFLVTRSVPHAVVERNIVRKQEEIVLQEGGGSPLFRWRQAARKEPSLPDVYLHTLADWGVHIEQHFRAPQDIEWVLDPRWRAVDRPVAPAGECRCRARQAACPPKTEPRLAGGRTVYPGRTSGKAFLVDEIQNIGGTPARRSGLHPQAFAGNCGGASAHRRAGGRVGQCRRTRRDAAAGVPDSIRISNDRSVRPPGQRRCSKPGCGAGARLSGYPVAARPIGRLPSWSVTATRLPIRSPRGC